MSGGPTIPGPHLRDPSSRTSPDANAPKSPTPSPASSTNRYARPVSKEPTNAPRRRARHLPFCPSPEDAGALSTPARTSVPIRIAPTTAGSDAAIYALMAIPGANPGASCRGSPAIGISTKPMAQFFMASDPLPTSSCASSPVWLKAWAFGARPGCSRSIRPRSSSGWWKPPRSSRPFRPISYTICASIRSNSTNCTPCSVR